MARLLTLYEEGEKKEYRGGGYKGGGGHGTSLGLFKKYFRPKLQFIPETL